MKITRARLEEIIHAAGLEPCDYEEVYSSIKTGEIVSMARLALTVLTTAPLSFEEEQQYAADFMRSRGRADLLVSHSMPYRESYEERVAHRERCDGALTNEGAMPTEPVSQAYKLPATRFQQVADLYGITSPTGSETSFTFDAFEASSFAKSGWSVQEYVELERYQQALTGNSPVIQDCWCRTCRPVTISDMRFVVCPECGNKRCPRANNHMNACTGSNEPGQEGSAYPAAPQQEGK
ncbi:hypothetical protein [Escherichia coli]|uniref:hypothetical protein n=1 Tax=Escherichia coli TaxID=562 RepID=UPI002032BBFA|nr:hypothetical protein [Escherichia coli]